MDRPFIKEMCEAYYNDKQLYKVPLWDNKENVITELNNELIALMDQVYLDDNEVYYELKSYNRVFQAGVIYNLLNEYLENKYNYVQNEKDSEYLDESFSSFLGGAIAIGTSPLTWVGIAALAGIIVWQYGTLSRYFYRVMNALGSTVDSIYKFLQNITREGRVKHSILITHLQNCYKKCGITSPKDVRKTTGMGITGQAFSAKSQEQATCLTECYLGFCLDQIQILAEAYVRCLKDSGEDVTELSNISILLKNPLGDDCDEYYKYLEKFNKDFREVLEVVFKNDPRSKQNYINEYNLKLKNIIMKARRG
jgi:hypothetical protein